MQFLRAIRLTIVCLSTLGAMTHCAIAQDASAEDAVAKDAIVKNTVTAAAETETAIAKSTVVVVVGAQGTPEYGEQFQQHHDRLQKMAATAEAEFISVGAASKGDAANSKTQLQQLLAEQSETSTEPFWLILIGHGTFDGKAARFNLVGPDVAAKELATWLDDVKRPLVVVNCASASAPFISALSAPNRTVVSATNSGYEQNATRFADYFTQAVGDIAADLDKDHQVSVLEAYLFASHRVADFYESDARLATEHALIDDNGDGRGTPTDWFKGVRVTKKSSDNSAADGLRAHQTHLLPSEQERRLSADARLHRDKIEQQIEQLRSKKDSLDEDEYYSQLEKLAVRLAEIYAGAAEENTRRRRR